MPALAVRVSAPYRSLVVVDEGTKIPVRRLTQASDFGALDSASIVHFIVVSGSQDARVVAAELEAFLIERAEALNDLSEDERRASDEAAFAFVRRLEQLGCAVCVGADQADWRFDDDPSKTRAWHIGCISVSNIDDEAPFATVRNLSD